MSVRDLSCRTNFELIKNLVLNRSEVIMHRVEHFYNHGFLLQLPTSKEFLICGVRLPNCESDEFLGENSTFTSFSMYLI